LAKAPTRHHAGRHHGREIHRVIGFGGKAKLVAELEPHLA
jgi:hypothetical protein